MRLLREAIEQIGKLFDYYDVLNAEVYEYLNTCYMEYRVPDKAYLSKLVNEHLRKEVDEWQVRKSD